MDGLRAIAVLSVLLFHIDEALLPGGFVGVDVFFVLSGYLISRNLLSEIEGRRFSLVEFYRRRIKRIAPALLVVVAATLVVSQLVMLPLDARAAAKSALFALASLANVYFWLYQDTGYFANDSGELPFLQLWSLGVEEQFYFVWPLLLAALYRPGRRRGFAIAIGAVALLSFAAGELFFTRSPSFVYYMLPTRAGELMFGALGALATTRASAIPALESKAGRAALSGLAWLGLAAIGASLFGLSERDVFPGLRAIPPTAGTTLVILAGHFAPGRLSRLLALRPMVWIGLLSYSAYLWHWPLLAFLRYGHPDFGPLAGMAVFALTFVLAWATYRFVEQPARHVSWPFSRVFLLQYGLPGGALVLLAVVAMRLDGYGLQARDAEYRASLAAMQQQVLPPFHFPSVCQRQLATPALLEDPVCVVGAKGEAPPRAILWGDSNAAHYVGVLQAFAEAAGFRFRNVAVGACPAIDGDPAPLVLPHRLKDCRASLALVRPVVETYPVVVLAVSWIRYEDTERLFADAQATIRRLAGEGKQVVVLGKIPEIPGYDRRCREKALRYPGLVCPRWTSPVLPEIAAMNERLRAFAATVPNVAYYDVTEALCREGTCSAFDADGRALYYDTGHLTQEASLALGRAIVAREGVPAPFRAIAAGEPVR
ncbi:MAG: acyltransferase family protein [Myxococcota bacterium]